jgi:hypothetical protein
MRISSIFEKITWGDEVVAFDNFRNRLVEIVRVAASTPDEYGNQVETRLNPVRTWASREQLTSTEDVLDRDQQARTFRYFFTPSVTVDGRSFIKDGDQELRVIGEPEVVSTLLGPHHIEALAEIVEG